MNMMFVWTNTLSMIALLLCILWSLTEINRLIDWVEDNLDPTDYDDIYDMLTQSGMGGDQIGAFLSKVYGTYSSYSSILGELDELLNTVNEVLDNEYMTPAHQKELEQTRDKIDEDYLEELGNTRVSKPPDYPEDKWNEGFEKVKGRKVNKTPNNIQVVRDGVAFGDSPNKIATELARMELSELNKPITKKSIDSRRRSYLDLVKEVIKDEEFI